MPEDLAYVGSVQYENTFAIIGGYHASMYTDTIYLYNPATEQFDLLEERLSRPKSYVTTFLVSEDTFAEC